MDVKLSYNHIKEYIDTDLDAYALAKVLTTRGPSIEKLEEINNDYLYHIEVTSNRVDMACVMGIACEAVAAGVAIFKKNILQFHTSKAIGTLEEVYKNEQYKKRIITIQNTQLFSKLLAIEMSVDKIRESTEKIKQRIEWYSGFKSVNNVVDISNYVMFETGIPSHIFDADKVRNGITLTTSKPGEKFVDLHGKEYILKEGDIVFKNNKGEIIDLCGVIGGKLSEVDKNTKNLLITIPIYNKYLVRRASLQYNERSIASTYFEKDLDYINGPSRTLERIIQLLKEEGAKATSQLFYFGYDTNEKINAGDILSETGVNFSFDEIRAKMGITKYELNDTRIGEILHGLGFRADTSNEKSVPLNSPSWRIADVKDVNDIVEEVARIYGYENLPNILQKNPGNSLSKENSWGVYGIYNEFSIHTNVKNILKEKGYNEIVSYPFTSQLVAENLNTENELTHYVKDSFNSEFVVMRESLLPSLLQTIATNKGKEKEYALFEIGKVYKKQVNKNILEQYPADEQFNLAILTTDKKYLEKTLVELSDKFNVKSLEYIKNIIHKENSTLEIMHAYLDKLGIQEDIFGVEINVNNLIS